MLGRGSFYLKSAHSFSQGSDYFNRQVSYMARKYKNPLVTVINPKSPAAESYRGLRTNIQFSVHDKQVRVIMVGSAQMNEGKTTTVSNLAVAYAHEGKMCC